ncbi:TetR/AcrR family transcriptional regulator [Streptomyces sp. NPDC048659]|uniref:TetR/AcrR family transcriptional regulator n=1 Tax=Streptomyces sp. NPDC048659 TaxID=3155489 RepID=UPI00341F3032
MATQVRAVRTRGRLVRAAAAEFDEAGYEGARLAHISELAAVSMGALTFHFPAKSALADAVEEEGLAITKALVERLCDGRAPGLEGVIGLTVGLVGLLEEDLVVRSSVRLARERPGGAGRWAEVWLPAVRDQLVAAYEGGRSPRVEELRQTLADMVVYLLAGAESQVRAGAQGPSSVTRSVAERMERIWRLALAGVSPAGA